MYIIQPYTKQKAKELGVTIKPSTNKKKKIDVFKDDKKIASIGAIGFNDFPTLLKTEPTIANERRRLYHIRHNKDHGTNGFYAKKLLW
jgi:hypothetical protein